MLRREVIELMFRLSGVTSAALVLEACKRESQAPAPSRAEDAPPRPSGLPPQVLQTVEAAVGRLLPAAPERGFPGAASTGVARYIDGQLSKDYFAPVARFLEQGFVFLDRVAVKEAGGRFHSRTRQQQDAVLSSFQRGAVRGLSYPTARFFEVFLLLTLEGHFGDPKYGGNRGGAAWAAIGVNPSHLHHAGAGHE